MQTWKSSVIAGCAVAVFLGGASIAGQHMLSVSGTLDEAVAKMRSQRSTVAKIVKIAESDTSMGGVSPYVDIVKSENLDLTDANTRNSVKSYKAVQRLMTESGFIGLDLLRDKQSQHELKWIDLYIFRTQSHGHSHLIVAEWKAPGSQSNSPNGCVSVDDSWHVCPVDLY